MGTFRLFQRDESWWMTWLTCNQHDWRMSDRQERMLTSAEVLQFRLQVAPKQLQAL